MCPTFKLTMHLSSQMSSNTNFDRILGIYQIPSENLGKNIFKKFSKIIIRNRETKSYSKALYNSNAQATYTFEREKKNYFENI